MNPGSMRCAATVLAIVASLASASGAAAMDRRQIAVTVESIGATNDQLRILSPNGALVRAFPARFLNFASWSRDEKTVAYGDASGLRLVPAAGGAARTVVPTRGHRRGLRSPTRSPTGWMRGDATESRLARCTWSAPTAATISHRRAAPGCGPPTWSPDETTLAWAESYPAQIVSAPASGGSVTPIVSAGPGEYFGLPAYSPDGKRIAYTHHFPGGPRLADQIVVRDLATGAETVGRVTRIHNFVTSSASRPALVVHSAAAAQR